MRQRWFGAAVLSLGLLLSVSAGGSVAAAAEKSDSAPLGLEFEASGSQQPLEKNIYYDLAISCKEGEAKLPTYGKRSLLPRTDTTFLHYIMISPNEFFSKPDYTAVPPDGTISKPIYIVDSTARFSADNRNCDKHYLIKDRDELHLVYSASYLKKYQAGPVIDAFKSADGVLTLAAVGDPIIAGAKALTKAVELLFSLMSKDEPGTDEKSLLTGTTTVKTKYSTVTISISPITSFVENGRFLGELNNRVKDESSKLTDVGKCGSVESYLMSVYNILDIKDRAFALTVLAAKSLGDADLIDECLGPDLRAVACKTDIIWKSIPSRLQINCEGREQYQPPYKKVSGIVSLFVNGLGRYTGTEIKETAKPVDKQAIEKDKEGINQEIRGFLADKVRLVDETFSRRIVPGHWINPDNDKIAAIFDGRNYRKVGCIAKTTETTGESVTNARVVFLAFEAKPDDKKVVRERGILVYPIFSNDRNPKIVEIQIWDNREWLDAVLQARERKDSCGQFDIKGADADPTPRKDQTAKARRSAVR